MAEQAKVFVWIFANQKLFCNFAIIKMTNPMRKATRAKLLVLFCCGLYAPQHIHADSIVLKDASVIEAFNVEIAGNWVLYTLEESADSQLQRIAKDKVFAIKETNGELRSITSDESGARNATAAEAPASPSYFTPRASEDNNAIISRYNTPILSAVKARSAKDSTNYCSDFVAIWGITSESILSDDNVAVSFERVNFADRGQARLDTPEYKIILTNKTGSPIYVDLANSFRISNQGTSEPYFSNASYSEGSNRSSGASLNLGAVASAVGIGGPIGALANGVGIGRGNENSASVTKTEQRFLTIPARSSVALPPVRFSHNGKIRDAYESLYFWTIPYSTFATVGESELKKADTTRGFAYYLSIEGGVDDSSVTRDIIQAPLGITRAIPEDESPKKLRRLITYSTDPDFSRYTTLDFTLYLRGVMGSNYRWNIPHGYNPKYVETSDLDHLLYGIGQVKKK